MTELLRGRDDAHGQGPRWTEASTSAWSTSCDRKAEPATSGSVSWNATMREIKPHDATP
jgi:hypothetical protein